LRIIALLPIKGNSERVKGKNFRDFLGRPLFGWILETLLSVPEVNEVVINTDAEERLRQSGLTENRRVHLRSRRPELCGDAVSMNKILADDVDNVGADIYLMTHATNPLLSRETIQRALSCFLAKKDAGEADSLFCVNVHQTRFYRADGSPVNHDPDNLVQTQCLEKWFEDNSSLYIFTAESFRASGARIGLMPIMFEAPKVETIDIDTPEDWAFAEVVARGLGAQGCVGGQVR
jgi:CMP-N-acetylneuraminic acid synthetase